MSTKMQNGSGSTTESQDDESHIKSLAELKSLWEGMASKNERSLNPNGQKKPQLVRGDRSRQMENPQWSSTLSPSTISGPMSTPTSSVATATLSLAAPSSSTTKLKSSTTTPVSGMATNRSSMTASVVPMATQASSTTIPSSSMIKPANYRATPPSSVTTGTSSVARTTSSTSTSGVLSNGKNSFRSNMTSQEPGKSAIRFESQAEATGRDDQVPPVKEASIESKDHQVLINRETQIKTSPTAASGTWPEATLTAVAPTGEGDSSQQQPRVVRGSILVRNSIDMIGWPRLLDVVETSDSDEGIVVEENTNLFHGRYFQLRENPLYFSDHEEQDEVEDRQDRSKTRREKAKAGNYLGSGDDGGPEGEKVSTLNMEKPRNTRPLLTQNQQDKDATSSSDNGPSSRSSLPFAADRCVKVDGPNRSEILRLVDDGSDGARQTVTVERTEEELTKEMMEALQVSGDPSKGVTNVDVVEERLDVELSNGLAQVKVTVHCERIVPNRMSGQSYRKSSVTVIRTTEVDMLATPERRQIYERVVDRYGTPEAEVSRSNALVHRNKLSTDDVYALYRVFVEVTGRSRSIGVDPGNQMIASLSKSEVAGLELLSGQSLPLSLLRLGPLISPVSLTQ